VKYHGHWRGCDGINGQEVCFLAVPRRTGDRFVQRTRNAKSIKKSDTNSKNILENVIVSHRKNLGEPDGQAGVAGPDVEWHQPRVYMLSTINVIM
jgi:hypothetical protein